MYQKVEKIIEDTDIILIAEVVSSEVIKERRYSTEEIIALGREIEAYSRKNIQFPKNFDVVKFVHSCR